MRGELVERERRHFAMRIAIRTAKEAPPTPTAVLSAADRSETAAPPSAKAAHAAMTARSSTR